MISCKKYDQVVAQAGISSSQTRKRKRKFNMSDSEIMTIVVLFHVKSYRNLKDFHLSHICKHMQGYFPNCVSYNRFVELQRRVLQPLAVYLKMGGVGKRTGMSFVDYTPLKVSHINREKQHKVFKGIAEKSFGTTSWFYGFKLHLVTNDKEEIVHFLITNANVNDRQPLKDKTFHENIFGKFFGDKGYLGKDLFEKLFVE